MGLHVLHYCSSSLILRNPYMHANGHFIYQNLTTLFFLEPVSQDGLQALALSPDTGLLYLTYQT